MNDQFLHRTQGCHSHISENEEKHLFCSLRKIQRNQDNNEYRSTTYYTVLRLHILHVLNAFAMHKNAVHNQQAPKTKPRQAVWCKLIIEQIFVSRSGIQ